jgi:hypothetical protein
VILNPTQPTRGAPSDTNRPSSKSSPSTSSASPNERQGLLERDAENSYLARDAVGDDPVNSLLGHSIIDRIAGIVAPSSNHDLGRT